MGKPGAGVRVGVRRPGQSGSSRRYATPRRLVCNAGESRVDGLRAAAETVNTLVVLRTESLEKHVRVCVFCGKCLKINVVSVDIMRLMRACTKLNKGEEIDKSIKERYAYKLYTRT